MSEQLISQIAQQIARQQLWQNIAFYTIALALIVVSSAISSYFGSYFRRRGEALATKTDFEQLSMQLRQTTTIAEGVRAAIAHSDWASREYKTLRRVKLEELLEAAVAYSQWADLLRNYCLYGDAEPPASSLSKVRMLGLLYFPELADPLAAFVAGAGGFQLWLYQRRNEILVAANVEAQMAIRARATNEMTTPYGTMLQSIAALERAAMDLMRRTLNVEAPAAPAEVR